jgi:hypothetical protein
MVSSIVLVSMTELRCLLGLIPTMESAPDVSEVSLIASLFLLVLIPRQALRLLAHPGSNGLSHSQMLQNRGQSI